MTKKLEKRSYIYDPNDYANLAEALMMTKREVKRCNECGRVMTDDECGDDLPEERVCDTCSNLVGIHVYEWRSDQWLFGYVQGEPILVDDYDGDDMWFEIDTMINGTIPCSAVYNETELRWETTEI